jgi:hypothetical protein
MITQFDTYIEREKELGNFKKSILNLIDDFVNINPEFCKNHQIPENYNKATDFYFSDPDELVIKYVSGDGTNIDRLRRTHILLMRDKDEYNDLLKFMEEPELYKNMKNYNL